MKEFKQKLEEYGLELIEKNTKEKNIEVKELHPKTSRAQEQESGLSRVLMEESIILIKNSEKFKEKTGMLDISSEVMNYYLTNTEVGIGMETRTISLFTYNTNLYADSFVMEHVMENKDYYRAKYPKWAMESLFEQEKSKKWIINQVYKNVWLLRKKFNRSEKAVEMFEEFIKTIEKT